MFEDEMLPEHAVRSDQEYRRLVEQELHDEAIAQAQAMGRSLTGMASALTGKDGSAAS
jgi:hypothetical protein